MSLSWEIRPFCLIDGTCSTNSITIIWFTVTFGEDIVIEQYLDVRENPLNFQEFENTDCKCRWKCLSELKWLELLLSVRQ